MGAWVPELTSEKDAEWVPMSWCPDGRFYGDMFEGKPMTSLSDVPDLGTILQRYAK